MIPTDGNERGCGATDFLARVTKKSPAHPVVAIAAAVHDRHLDSNNVLWTKQGKGSLRCASVRPSLKSGAYDCSPNGSCQRGRKPSGRLFALIDRGLQERMEFPRQACSQTGGYKAIQVSATVGEGPKRGMDSWKKGLLAIGLPLLTTRRCASSRTQGPRLSSNQPSDRRLASGAHSDLGATASMASS